LADHVALFFTRGEQVTMRMRADSSVLAIVDIQPRLAAAIPRSEQVIARTGILLRAAARLAVPVLVSEQYPEGLGSTDARLRLPRGAAVVAKTSFSALGEPAFRTAFEGTRRSQVVLCGMETHVCVLQTALELCEAGHQVFVVADAVGSRRDECRTLGLARMRDRGIDIVDSEMVVFEWAERAGTDQFRELVKLIK
jgi:nicotinamidase-related amidase